VPLQAWGGRSTSLRGAVWIKSMAGDLASVAAGAAPAASRRARPKRPERPVAEPTPTPAQAVEESPEPTDRGGSSVLSVLSSSFLAGASARDARRHRRVTAPVPQLELVREAELHHTTQAEDPRQPAAGGDPGRRSSTLLTWLLSP